MSMSSTSALGATFNVFLFATVCEERDGMPVSVISTLARLDLDPWAVAAELAQMPAGDATRRLSSLLAGIVDDPRAQPDRATIATRLVGLLPSSAKTEVPSRPEVAGGLTAAQPRALGLLCLALLVSMAISAAIASLAPGSRAAGSASAAMASTAAHR